MTVTVVHLVYVIHCACQKTEKISAGQAIKYIFLACCPATFLIHIAASICTDLTFICM